jgi:hypothetical protein
MEASTIFTLNILINLCLILAVAKLNKRRYKNIFNKQVVLKDERVAKLIGQVEKFVLKAKVSEKLAERAFNTANSASLGVIALQKALQTPRLLTKHQSQRNQLAKNEIDTLFHEGGGFDFLRPVLSDQENDLLDEIEKHKLKNGGSI